MPAIDQHQLPICKVQFPEIELQTRDAHKLRGYFGTLFKEHAPILSNHFEDGNLRYKYPLVQYKVVRKTPMLIGIKEGAKLLTQLFLRISEIDIDGKRYPVNTKNISQQNEKIGFSRELIEYKFNTLWMALNQENFKKFSSLKDKKEESKMLDKLLVSHVLGFFKNIDLYLKPDERLIAKGKLQQRTTRFKDQKMLGFTGSFMINALLPDDIGIGKSVSRGFGTLTKEVELF